MQKSIITPEESVEKVNAKLPSDLNIFLVPRGSTGKTARGYDWDRNLSLEAQAKIQRAASQIQHEYITYPVINYPVINYPVINYPVINYPVINYSHC